MILLKEKHYFRNIIYTCLIFSFQCIRNMKRIGSGETLDLFEYRAVKQWASRIDRMPEKTYSGILYVLCSELKLQCSSLYLSSFNGR